MIKKNMLSPIFQDKLWFSNFTRARVKRTVSIISHLTCKFKIRLRLRYFDFKRDLKFSLPRFNVKKETETERVLSFA